MTGSGRESHAGCETCRASDCEPKLEWWNELPVLTKRSCSLPGWFSLSPTQAASSTLLLWAWLLRVRAHLCSSPVVVLRKPMAITPDHAFRVCGYRVSAKHTLEGTFEMSCLATAVAVQESQIPSHKLMFETLYFVAFAWRPTCRARIEGPSSEP